MSGVILYLPVKLDKNIKIPKFIDDKLLNYEPTIKKLQPYDENKYKFNEENNEIKEEIENLTYDIILDNNNLNIEIKDYSINHNKEEILNKKCKCWWCCYSFNNNPIYIPTDYENNEFKVYGNFCSFSCALSYNYYNNKDIEQSIKNESLIYTFYNKIENNSSEIKKIKYAPPKELLIDFGGTLTIDEFRNNQIIYNIIYPPMSITIPYLEKIKKSKVINDKNEPDDDLVLRRSKSIRRNNTIFSLIKK